MPYNEDRLVVVFASSYEEAGFFKGLLEDSGIPAFLKDEFMGNIAPWYVSAGGAGAVKVLVFERDADLAKNIIHGFMNQEGQEWITDSTSS